MNNFNTNNINNGSNFTRTKDLTQIFNDKWKANYGNNEKVQQAKKDFNFRMFGIRDKEDVRKEMREFNSVSGQVERLNQKMNSIPRANDRFNNKRGNF